MDNEKNPHELTDEDIAVVKSLGLHVHTVSLRFFTKRSEYANVLNTVYIIGHTNHREKFRKLALGVHFSMETLTESAIEPEKWADVLIRMFTDQTGTTFLPTARKSFETQFEQWVEGGYPTEFTLKG